MHGCSFQFFTADLSRDRIVAPREPRRQRQRGRTREHDSLRDEWERMASVSGGTPDTTPEVRLGECSPSPLRCVQRSLSSLSERVLSFLCAT